MKEVTEMCKSESRKGCEHPERLMATNQDTQELYKEFDRELSAITRLAKLIEVSIGRLVGVHPKREAPKWGYWAPKLFANARYIKSRASLRISTSKKWATGVKWDGEIPKGWYVRDDAVWWEVPDGDSLGEQRIAASLAKVCEARHR